MNYYPYVTGYQHHKIGKYEKTVIGNLYKKKNVTIPRYLKYYFMKKYEEAIKVLNQGDKDFQSEYALGFLLKKKKRYDKAIRHFKLALTMRSKSILTRYSLADSYWSLGKEKKAEEEFSKILVMRPNHYESLMNLGVIHLKAGKFKLASAYLKKVLKIQPMHWAACELLFELTSEKKYQKCVSLYKPAH